MKTIIRTLLIISLFLAGCKSKENQPDRKQVSSEYQVMSLAPKNVSIHLVFPATIEGQQVIEIRPMISGYIQEIYVNEGDFVKKGQLLFKIKNPQYEQAVITANASIRSAEAAVNTSKMEVEKVKPLVEKEIVSDYKLQTAEYTLQTNEAQLAQAKATLANAETNLGYTIIRSPESGLIGTFPYKIGALVSSNSSEALTTLSNIDSVFAYFSWSEKKLLDFLSSTKGLTMSDKLGNLPPATLILANKAEYPEKGKIEMASGLISTETGAATFKGIFPNSNGLIRSGASATISIPEQIDSVLVIPQSATYELQDKRFIYIVADDNTVTATNFSYISSDDGKYFYVTNGLNAGDRVVIEGIATLSDGITIIPKVVDNADYSAQY